ncbi:MAG: NAD(P)-dependent oxidoreductase [Ignavibacteriaceae bacterium]|jgi:nucleoside-diphosphate-sugar epimerase|nr:NAD(P)-dependent oxidoreductase [Ignavibacteriaceae bacterium]
MNSKQIAAVTGANGFVGSHLVDYLLGKNFEVRCIVRKSSNLQWLIGKDVKIYDCGLFDKKGLREAFKDVNYIFHVAGVVKAKDEEGYFKGNVEATKVLLEVASEVKENIKKFVVVSSQTVSGPSLDGKPVTEEMKPNPLTTYARSKLKQEEVALSYKEIFPVTICRAPAIFGERDTEIFIYFQVFNRGLTTMIGFDKKELSLLHVTDLAEGLYLAAISEKSNGEIYFIGSENFYNWDQVGDITSKVLGKKAVRIKIPHLIVFIIAAIAQFFAMFSSKPATLNIEKAKDLTQKLWICDTSKAIRELGYRQKVSIEEGIKRTCEWYKKMKWI